jgi:ribosomal protein L17
MRHRNAGYKLGRNTSHRRAMLRNLVTSVILMDRVETTITKCKATRPLIEKMITLGKRGTVHARRQAAAYLMTPESVDRLFATVARAMLHARAAISALRASEPARVTQPRWLTSSFSVLSMSSTRRLRSVLKPAPRSVKSSPSRWKSAAKVKPATLTPKHKLPQPNRKGAPHGCALFYRLLQNHRQPLCTMTRFFPARFAAYRASSAISTSWNPFSSDSLIDAIPTLMVSG